jgi:hypothetical protein
VLDIAGRGEAIDWLSEAGQFDSAVVLGTLKATPTGLPAVDAYWIEAGEIKQKQAAAIVESA